MKGKGADISQIDRHVYIPLWSEAGRIIYRIRAEDPNLVFYNLLKHKSIFNVNNTTGEVYLRRKLRMAEALQLDGKLYSKVPKIGLRSLGIIFKECSTRLKYQNVLSFEVLV